MASFNPPPSGLEQPRPSAICHGRTRTVSHPATTFVLLSLLCLASGCASTARDISASATPVAVRTGLHEANTPDSQQELLHILDSPAVQRTGQSIGEGVAIGLYNQTNELVDGSDMPTTNPSTATTKPGASALLGLTHGGGLSGFVQSSVQEAFLAATNPQFRAGEQAMSESIGQGFVQGMITVFNKQGTAIGETVRRQLGPIVQEMIREQIAPAARDMIEKQLAPAALQVWREGAVETLQLTVRPDLQPDVMKNAENASIGASHGTHQAMIESGILTPLGNLNPQLKLYFWTVIIGVALILIALFCLLVLLNLLVLHHLRRRHRTTSSQP